MEKLLKLELANFINNKEGKEYLYSTIAYGAAPTILKKKPSNLLIFSNQGKSLMDLWNSYKDDIISELNIDYYILRKQDNSITVLFYNKKMLEAYTSLKSNSVFLKEKGYYLNDSLEQKLEKLKLSFLNGCPHEVGVFLGIPLDDVLGFIKNQGEDHIMCKYWKVYNNKKRAQILFSIYDSAKQNMAYKLINAI